MAGTYQYITLTQLIAQLAARLSDPYNIFWIQAELTAYVVESLQTFSAFSGFWRARGTFDTTQGDVFYDLPTNLPAECGYNVEDITLIPVMCYQLLEPPPAGLGTSGVAWTGTDMFTLQDLQYALERRRNQFLADTGCVVTEFTQGMPSPPVGRVQLADDIIDVRRAQWFSPIGSGSPPANVYFNLWRLTEYQLTTQSQTWSVNPSQPYGYSVISTPPLTLQVGPVPSTVGELDLVCVETGAALNPAEGVLMGIPDDFCWIVKWGALADLLGMDGQARDPQRAQFCEQRYQLGVELARQVPLALQVLLNNVPQIIGSIQGLDSHYPGWQGSAQGPTQNVVSAGRNLVAVNPPPDAGPYSLAFDVIANATLPASGSSYIQVGREQIDGILDYAEHLACFKMGGAEFMATERQANNFIRQASIYNERLSAAALFSDGIGFQSLSQDARMPRRMSGKALNG